MTVMVPSDVDMEVQKLTLKNDTDKEKTLTLYAAEEWCLWNAVDDNSTNFQRNWNIGEVEIEDGTIYHKTEYRERRYQNPYERKPRFCPIHCASSFLKNVSSLHARDTVT